MQGGSRAARQGARSPAKLSEMTLNMNPVSDLGFVADETEEMLISEHGNSEDSHSV